MAKKRGKKRKKAKLKAKSKTKALHMSVLGQDQFISKIICLLGTHPDPWTKEKHWGSRGICYCCCPCCFGACDLCYQIRVLKRINRQWRDRTSEFDGKAFLWFQGM